jgi:hypothetical protein
MSHLLLVNKLRSYHRFDTCQGTRKKLLLLQIMAKDKQIIWQLAMLRVLCSIFLPTQKVLRRRTLLRSCEITWRSQRQIMSLSLLSFVPFWSWSKFRRDARNVEQVVSVGEDVAGSEPMRSSACVATAESERGRRST